MSALAALTAERPATAADLGFIPSPQLQADIARFRAMRTAWDEMAAAALDFDTNRYNLAKAGFNAAREGC